MGRAWRIELAGGFFHITSRGDRREDIYLDDEDRRKWLLVLGTVCSRFNWICHAFCQMDNHYHLILETLEANLSSGMRQLNGVYAQAFNRRYGLVGHLFQGRYKSILVEQDTYLLELSRYVVLNPVRAARTKQAEEWPWSSYHQMIGSAPEPSWLCSKWILSQFHADAIRSRELFKEFVRSGIGRPCIWESMENQLVLGSRKYVEIISHHFPHLDFPKRVSQKSSRRVVKKLSEYEKSCASHREAIVEAYRSGGYTMTEIASHFAVNQSTVSRMIKASELRSSRQKQLTDF